MSALSLLLVCAACSGDSNESSPDTTEDAAHTTDSERTKDAWGGGDARSGDVTDVGQRLSLIDHEEWSKTASSDDPLGDHRPETVDCADDAVEVGPIDGEQALSVHTSGCNYLSLSQTLRAPVEKGEELDLRVFRSALDYDSDAQAHAALLLDDSVVWEEFVDIPASESDLYLQTWEADRAYSDETEVTFHLHNHGSNTWSFIELSTATP